MAWSYNSMLLNDKDRVRFLVQDTVAMKQLLQDEEILWSLSTQGSVLLAASQCCKVLASRFSQKAGEVSYAGARVSFTERANAYRTQAEAFQVQATGSTQVVPIASAYAGGIDVADKAANADNRSLVAPGMKKRQFDYWGSYEMDRDLEG